MNSQTMDLISHTLTGVAVGTVFAAISNDDWKRKCSIIFAGGIGGALPDIDAISLWSRFDTTIGSFFGLEHSGKVIYSGKFWYSHHAAFHSILAPLLIILLSLSISSILRKKFGTQEIRNRLEQKKFSFLAFFFGFLFHLFEDMPTPASVWGGVNLFYPSDTYIGGFGNIWWWNNYDLVLIIVSVIVLNLTILFVPKFTHKVKMGISISVFTLGLSLFLFQINTRPVDFSYSGNTDNFDNFEAQSKQIQKEILGETVYDIMTKIDDRIPLNF